MTALFEWKKQGWLAAFVPADVARYPADQRDPDGFFATDRLTLSPIEYNTKLVKPEEAPKSFADLLDPQWKSKIVKAHPGYSGTIMTVTFEISRYLGWDYLKKLGQQQVMQVQSAADPPKKVAQGERPVAADGGEYLPLQMIEKGAPLALVYPAEGTPSIPGGAGVVVDALHPECGACVCNLPVLERRTAAPGGHGDDPFGTSRGEAAAGHEGALGNQDHEARRRRPGAGDNRDQDEICRILRALAHMQKW